MRSRDKPEGQRPGSPRRQHGDGARGSGTVGHSTKSGFYFTCDEKPGEGEIREEPCIGADSQQLQI